jgi:putative phosphoesterase
MKVGVISDTHGLLRPEAAHHLAGVAMILHAGDVGDPAILHALRNIAPVTAIRGNVDTHGPCSLLPATEYVTVAEMNIYMLHDLGTLDLDPAAARIAAVIYGHSHKPSIEWRKGVLFFNPGAAGTRRFSLPVSLGVLEVTPQSIQPKLITLL